MPRSIRILIGLSLALNLALAAIIAVGRATSETTLAPAVRLAPNRTAPAQIDPAAWAKLKADDPRELMARLQAAGFPSDVVRLMIGSEINLQFAARWRDLDRDANSTTFWKTANDEARRVAMRRLSFDQQKAIRAVLGDEPDPADPETKLAQQRLVAGLSPEGAAAVKRLTREFTDRREEIYMLGVQTPADRAKLQALEKEQRAAINATLSPADRATYELWNGMTANTVRYELAAFNPTEAEFLAVYNARKPFDDRYRDFYSPGVPRTPEQEKQQGEDYRRMITEVKAALGPTRAADYERTSDYAFQQATRLAERLQLPDTAANEIWAVQKDIQKRQFPSDAAGPKTDLAALAAEAKTRLVAVLGEKGFEAYRRNGGDWLQSLEPRPEKKK